MKSSTFVAKLQELGITPSYSRRASAMTMPTPRVCSARASIAPIIRGHLPVSLRRNWALAFECWYNHDHKHCNLKLVSPAERRCGADLPIFANRTALYERMRIKHPARWSGAVRDWSLSQEVWLNRPAQENILREAA